MLEIMSEYDGTHSNGGIRVKLFNHFTILAGFLRFQYISGRASFSFQL